MRQLRRGTGPPCLMATARASIQGAGQSSALVTPAEFSRVGFLGRRSLVPVGAGVVMGWGGVRLPGGRQLLWSAASLSIEERKALRLPGRRQPHGKSYAPPNQAHL